MKLSDCFTYFSQLTIDTSQRAKAGGRASMAGGDVSCPTKAPLHHDVYHFGKGPGFHKKYFAHFSSAAMNCFRFAAQSTATEAGPLRPQPSGGLHTTYHSGCLGAVGEGALGGPSGNTKWKGATILSDDSVIRTRVDAPVP